MGWSSAGTYFELVAHALQDNEVDDYTQYEVLLPLAKALKDNDWDTLDESLEACADNPAVVRVMAEFGYKLPCECKCCDHEERY